MGFDYTGAGAWDNRISSGYGHAHCLVPMGSGRFLCVYSDGSSPNYPYALVVEVDSVGDLTLKTERTLDNATWKYSRGNGVKAGSYVIVIGADGGSAQLRLLSFDGSWVITMEQQNSLSSHAQPILGWDEPNARGLMWYPNGGFSNIRTMSLSGTTITLGSEEWVDHSGSKNYSNFTGFDHEVLFDSTSGRFLLFYAATRSGTDGVWVLSCKVSATPAITDETTPVLVAEATTSAGQIRGATDGGNHVITFELDGETHSALITVSGSTVTVESTQYCAPESTASYGCTGIHPVTGNPFFLQAQSLIDRFFAGKITSTNDILWTPEPSAVDPYPSSSITTDGFTQMGYDSTDDFMVFMGDRSDECQLVPFKWSDVQFVELSSIIVAGGEFPPMDVDITIPTFTMWVGNLVGVTVDAELPALEVQDFSLTTEIIPYLYGEMEPLEGAMNGGASLGGEMAALEGTVTLYNTTTALIVGELPALEGEMSGFVTRLMTIDGEMAALEGGMWGGVQLYGEMAPLQGAMTITVAPVLNINGEMAPLEGEMEGTFNRGMIIYGEMAPMEMTYGYIEGELAPLTGLIDLSPVSADGAVAWVMNKTHQGISRYPDYSFTFILRWKGKQLLAASDGVYEFNRSEDQPEPIESRFVLPTSDYGTAEEKRCPRVYMQGMLDGQMKTGITYDETEEVSQLAQGVPGVNYWRTKMGRGPKGHHLQIAVENVSGADFEIEQLDALINVLGRKI